ncbi:MAG: helix-turn-helix domain-containing protein [Spirochaetota bacterium]
METFGTFFQKERQKLGISLRKFCLDNNLDPSNISKMERGLINPPSEDILLKYAKALNISTDSETWTKMRDLAHIARQSIPPEVLSNEQIAERLPLFFRSARGEKLTEEELKELLSIIKKS